MTDHQEEHLSLIGIVRRWCKQEGGHLIIFFPEVASSTVNPYHIDSYARDGHESANYMMLVNTRLTIAADYESQEVKDFVAAYERAHNVTVILRKRNNIQVPTINTKR